MRKNQDSTAITSPGSNRNSVDPSSPNRNSPAIDDLVKAFVDASPDLCIIYNQDLHILYLNQTALEYAGANSYEELLGKPLEVISPTIVETGIKDDYLKVLKTGKPLSRESTESTPIGTRHFSIRAFKLGEHLAVIAADETERKTKELKAQKSLDQIEKYVEETTDLHVQVDPQGHIIYANSVLGNILGLSIKKLTGRSLFEFLHKDDREKTISSYKTWLNSRQNIATLENRLVDAGDRVHWMHWTVNINYDDLNHPLLLTCIARDVSDLRQAEERVYLQADIIEQLHEAVVTTDTNLNIIECNKEASALFGHTKAEILGKTITHLLAGKERRFLPDQMVELQNTNGINTEAQFLRKDGSQFAGLVRLSLLEDQTHKNAGYIAAIIDISGQKQMLRDLQVSEHRLRNAQRLARLGYFEWNLQQQSLWLSEEIYRIYRLDKTITDFPPNTLFKMTHKEDKKQLEEKINLCVEREMGFSHECRIIDTVGTSKIVHVQGELIGDDENNSLILTGTIQDITRRKQAEEELRQYKNQLEDLVKDRTQHIETLNKELLESSRQAGMAEVATGVLHNVGNVLNSINISVNIAASALHRLETQNIKKVCDLLDEHKGSLGVFLDKTGKGLQLIEYLNQLASYQENIHQSLNEEMQSMESHVNHVKHIVRMQQSHTQAKKIKEEVRLAELLEHAITICGLNSDKLAIKTIREYQDQDLINIEIHKLLQILVNLLSNAKEALLSSNTTNKQITITTRCSDKEITISIEDTGIGIDGMDQEKVFGMGFSTKPDGHGFGLHTSANLAAELGGMISAESQGKGKGACFTLRLKK